MGRQRKRSLTEALIAQPWWVPASFGVASYLGMQWIAPSLLPPILAGVGIGLKAIAWVPLAWFFFIGLLSFVRSYTEPKMSSVSTNRAVSHSRKQAALPSSTSTKKLGMEWGNNFNKCANVPVRESVYPEWTIEALKSLEWKRFELLCAKYYEITGFRSETMRCGPDGGIDVKLYRVDPDKPIAIVQCKAWNGIQVGVGPVRELLGVMTSEKVGRGIFLTTSTYTKDALAFAETNPILLLDGSGFLEKIDELPDPAKQALIEFAFAGG